MKPFDAMDAFHKLDSMTVLIGTAASVIIATLVFLLTKLSSSEESNFAEQVKQKKQLLEKFKVKPLVNHKEKKKKPDKKVSNRKESSKFPAKSNTNSDTNTLESRAVGLDHPHVEYEPDPIIITEETPVHKPQESEGEQEVHSILHNREQKSLIAEKLVVDETHFSRIPKDEIEVEHDRRGKKQKKRGIKSDLPTNAPQSEEVPIQEELIVINQSTTVQQSAPPTQNRDPVEEPVVQGTVIAQSARPLNSSKPAELRSETDAPTPPEVSIRHVITLLKQGQLSQDDKQALIEELQCEPAGDNSTKEQLKILKQAYNAEQLNFAATNLQLKDLNQKLNAAENKARANEHAAQTASRQLLEMKAAFAADQVNYRAHVQDLTEKLRMLDQRTRSAELAAHSSGQQIKHHEAAATIAQQHIVSAQSAHKEVSDRLVSCEENLQSTNQALQLANQRVTKLEDNLKSEQNNMNSTQSMVAELKDKLALAERENEATALKTQSASSQVEEIGILASKAEKKLKDELVIHQQARYQDSVTIKQLRAELESMVEQNKALKKTLPAVQDVENVRKELTTLESEIRHQQVERDSFLQRNRELEKERENLKKQLHESRTKLEQNVKQQSVTADFAPKSESRTPTPATGLPAGGSAGMNELQAKVNSLEEEIVKLQEKNNNLRRKNWSLVESLKQAELSSRKVDDHDTENKLRDQVKKMATMNIQLQSLEDEINYLRSTLSANQLQLKSSSGENAKLKSSLKIKDTELSSYISKYRSLEGQLQHKSAQISAMERQLESANSSEQEGVLQREVERLQMKNNDLRRKNWSLVDSVKALEQSVENNLNLTEIMNSEILEKDARLANLQSEMKVARTHAARMESDNSSQASALSEMQRSENTLKLQLDELRRENIELQSRGDEGTSGDLEYWMETSQKYSKALKQLDGMLIQLNDRLADSKINP